MTSTTLTLDDTAYADFVGDLATGEDPHGLVSPDVVAEMTFPHISFRLDGKAALDASRDRVSPSPWEVDLGEVLPTPLGFVAVIDTTVATDDGRSEHAHTVSLVTITGGQMVRMQHWCSGPL